jgi:AbrB family looped-hinge helix DNA binding protein
MLVEFKQKSQVTIPKDFVKELNLKEGDKLEVEIQDGRLIITPMVVVPKDQAWFYSPEWQAMEREVEQQIKAGQIHTVDNKDELFKDLGLDKL